MSDDAFRLKLQQLRATIASITFEELVRDYEQLEDDVKSGILGVVIEALENAGAEIKGSIIIFRQQPLQINSEYQPVTRQYTLLMLPPGEVRKPRAFRTLTIDHEGFGRVRVTRLIVPLSLVRFGETVAPLIRDWVESAYLGLEAALLAGVETVRALPLRGIHESFRRYAAQQNVAEEIASRSLFSVTNLQELVFRYELSNSQLTELIRRFKHEQQPSFSPFEGLIALLTREMHDVVLDGSARFENGVFTVSMMSLSSLNTDMCFWNAEQRLFRCPTLSAMEVAKVDKYELQVNFPTPAAGVMRTLVAGCAPILRAQFVRNVEEFERSVTTARRLVGVMTSNAALRTGVRMVTEFIAEFVASVIRKLSGNP